jgi:hypothetical protein
MAILGAILADNVFGMVENSIIPFSLEKMARNIREEFRRAFIVFNFES